jgi:hypothetical protein
VLDCRIVEFVRSFMASLGLHIPGYGGVGNGYYSKLFWKTCDLVGTQAVGKSACLLTVVQSHVPMVRAVDKTDKSCAGQALEL